MWSILAVIIDLIKKVFGIVSSTSTAKYAAEADVAIEEAKASSEIQRRWYLPTVVSALFAFPYVLYTWKAVGWDKVIGPILGYHTRTDLISGPLGTIFIMIVGFYFLHAIGLK